MGRLKMRRKSLRKMMSRLLAACGCRTRKMMSRLNEQGQMMSQLDVIVVFPNAIYRQYYVFVFRSSRGMEGCPSFLHIINPMYSLVVGGTRACIRADLRPLFLQMCRSCRWQQH